MQVKQICLPNEEHKTKFLKIDNGYDNDNDIGGVGNEARW